MGEPKRAADPLRDRLLVSFLGIPGLLLLVWLGGIAYAVLIFGIVLLGLREYLRLLETDQFTPRPWPLYLAAVVLLAAAGQEAGLWNLPLVPSFAQGFLVVSVLLLMVLQTWEVLTNTPRSWLNLSVHLTGFVWIAGFGCTFILLREMVWPTTLPAGIDTGFRITLALYVSVWLCDTMAYIMGKRFGRTKILPEVSPKKTVVGTAAGLVTAIVVMQIFGLADWLPGLGMMDLLILGIIVGDFGQLGDFVESRLKRDYGVKDTGALLPGHGGVLDRFDSLLFVMPLSYLYLRIIIR